MMNSEQGVFFISISTDDLRNLIFQAVKEGIDSLKPPEEDRLMTNKEVCKLFNITTPTLYKWIREGHLKNYKKGGRVYFKQSEINNSLKCLKKYHH